MLNLLKLLRGRRSSPPEYRVPPGQRIYAVGDVHGCARELDSLLNAISSDCAATDKDTQLIFLGDLVDRGPASADVMNRLCVGDLPAARHAFLMGNHEEVMLAVYDGDVDRLDGWLRYGGIQTLESYGISREEVFCLGLDLPAVMAERIPAEHIEFMRGFADCLQIGDYLFVHAGIRPGVAVEEQSASDLRWMRGEFLDDARDHGLIVVHGHTISSEPDVHHNRIGVDTGCYKSGTLTALVLEGTDWRFLTNRQ